MSSGPDKKEEIPCHAFHQTDGSTHFVGIGNLRVLITNDDGAYFAQGLEIDYATEGTSLEDVKHNFETGLSSTIDEYITIYGGLEKFLSPAPSEVWSDLNSAAKSSNLLSQVSVHIPKELPFEGISYLEKKAA